MRSAKVDANQDQIVQALRAAGATVQSLARMGKGCPDLLVGFRAMNYLIEIKDGRRPPSEIRLTPDQTKWHGEWAGRVHIAYCVDDALVIIDALRGKLK
jgi:hypothetical protein